MADFRYAQFCPLTRAVEILGERWTLLVLRELFLGPKRFSDIKSALNGVSSSVLADRLTKLEERGIITHRELPPPVASAVYELDEAGRALQPLLAELTRWGLRFMGTPSAGDTFRPEWLVLALQVFARPGPSAPVGALIHIVGNAESIDIYVQGGPGGTVVSRSPMPFELRISAPPQQLLMFLNGLLSADGDPTFRSEGDTKRVRLIPSLFDFTPTPAAPREQPESLPITQPVADRPVRSARTQTATRGNQGATRQ